jgi:hypothetical protein
MTLERAIIEPLILQLESQQGFKINDECQVSSLAFADSILLAPDIAEAKILLETTEKYLQGLRMGISAPKCAVFQIRTTKDSWYLTDPVLTTANGDRIPNAEANTTIKYLGGKISPWKGLTIEQIERDFEATLQRVQRLALKPHQKATLIATYLIPHYSYTITLAVAPTTLIRRMDQILRRTIKSIYHLPQCTAGGLLYFKKKDGGLGIPRLETMATSINLKTGLKFLTSIDPVMKALAKESHLEQKLKRIAQMARIEWPIQNIAEIDRYRAGERRRETARWASLQSQGKAAKSFVGNKVANAWLKNPQLLKPSKYITALKMRANVLPTRRP